MRLPARFSQRIGTFKRFHWKIRKFQPESRGGGAFKGSLTFSAIFGCSWVSVAITREAMESLGVSVKRFYAIDA